MGANGGWQELTRVNGGCWILDIGLGLSKLVDIKGAAGMSSGQWGFDYIKGVKGIHRYQQQSEDIEGGGGN